MGLMFPGSLRFGHSKCTQAKCVLAVEWGFVQMVNVGLLSVVSRGALWVSPLGPGWLKSRIQCPQRVHEGGVSGVTSLEESGLVSHPLLPDFNTDNFICKEDLQLASPAHQVGAGRGTRWCCGVTRSSKRPTYAVTAS